MIRTLVKDLKDAVGQEVCVQGWVQKIRDQKAIMFLVIRDHTGVVQAVFDRSKQVDSRITEALASLTTESAVTIFGRVVANPVVKLGGIEIDLSDIHIESIAEMPPPLDPFARVQARLENRLDWRFLDLRRPENYLVFRVQTIIEAAMRRFWLSEGFLEIHSPKLMGSASESGAELFTLQHFGQTASLAQSPQFYKQMAMCAGFDKVFEIGPVFRANPSFTSRHDTEFTSVDVEVSWIETHDDVMKFEERWLNYVIQAVKDEAGDAVRETFGREIVVPALPFPRIPMAEARKRLSALGYEPPAEGKGDLDPQGERMLGDLVQKEYGHEFVFVTDYPISVRPFYHMRYTDDPGTTKSFDLIWKGIEITTGAQREHRYEILRNQAIEKGIDLESIQFYLDFFRYGAPPHGGFGFGLTRMLMIMLGFANVREVTFLYRGPNRLTP